MFHVILATSADNLALVLGPFNSESLADRACAALTDAVEGVDFKVHPCKPINDPHIVMIIQRHAMTGEKVPAWMTPAGTPTALSRRTSRRVRH